MRLVLLCSALAVLIAAAPIDLSVAQSATKQTKQTKQPKQAKKKSEPAKQAAPRLRRGDDMTPVAAATQPEKKRARARKPADPTTAAVSGAGDGVAGGKATVQDVAACGQVKEPDAAIAGCTRLIEDGKQKPKARIAAYYNRGNAHAAKGDNAAAIADFDEALKLDPKNSRALNNRGSARSDLGETDQAIADFDAALKLDTRFASAWFNRANAYAIKGETARAIEDHGKALKFNRRNVNGYIARGTLLLAGGATAKARADMQAALRLDRRNAYVVLWHDIVERRAKQKGVLADGKGLRDVELKGWPAPVLMMFAGETKPETVLEAADDQNAGTKRAHTCEANFYSGEYALIAGNRDEATKLFRAAAKDCPHGFLEGIAAAAELKGMGEQAAAN